MTPSIQERIPFIDLGAQRTRIQERIDAAIARVLRHGQYILGPEVSELEGQLASYSGASFVVSCANGTDALELALTALGIRPGDQVVVPAFTFCATAEAVIRVGGIPRFADIDPLTFNLDAKSVGSAFDRASPPPVGLIAVDLFGQPANYAALGPIAAEHGAWILADSAQSFGASAGGARVGTLAPVTTTSFFPAKPLGCYGDGGAVLVDSNDTAERLQSLRVHGMGATKYDNVRIGRNSRLDTIQAAILLEKLAVFDHEIEVRQRIATRYSAALREFVQVPRLSAGNTSVWAQYTIVLAREDRERVRKELQTQGIPTAVYYPIPLHRQIPYRPYISSGEETPVSEALAARVLSLPMHPYLDEKTQERIVTALRSALR